MTWLSPAPRRLERSRRATARHAIVLTASLGVMPIVMPTSVRAAARTQEPALEPAPACPADPVAAPPSEALALKNAAQEMRAAQSWAKASRLFRDAVEELPACATYADERLRWSLWAVETFDRAQVADDGQLLRALEDAVDKIETTPNGRLLPDYPQLVAARDRLRDSAPWRPFTRAPDQPRKPMAIRLGIGLMAGGAPVLLTGTILAGVFGARAVVLNDRLTGPAGVYEQWGAAGCGPAAEPGEASACAGLRDTRTDIRSQGAAVNRVVIASLVLVGVGSAVVLAGLGTYLHGRKQGRRLGQRADLRILPSFGGLTISGRF